MIIVNQPLLNLCPPVFGGWWELKSKMGGDPRDVQASLGPQGHFPARCQWVTSPDGWCSILLGAASSAHPLQRTHWWSRVLHRADWPINWWAECLILAWCCFANTYLGEMFWPSCCPPRPKCFPIPGPQFQESTSTPWSQWINPASQWTLENCSSVRGDRSLVTIPSTFNKLEFPGFFGPNRNCYSGINV